MSSIPIFGVPFYNRLDLLHRLIKSIDVPVDNLVIVNNGRAPSLDAEIRDLNSLISSVSLMTPLGRQLGVAGAWNYILRFRAAPFYLIANSDIAFSPGDLKIFLEHASRNSHCGVVLSEHDFAFFALTPKALELVGYFDENFYPAYFEDFDYFHRANLYGCPIAKCVNTHITHGDSRSDRSCTTNSDPDLYEQVEFIHKPRNAAYYRLKWGTEFGGSGAHKSPFDL